MNCPVCATPLSRRQIKMGNRTCSRSCGQWGRSRPAPARYMPRSCVACATPLAHHQLKKPRQRFCSKRCSNRAEPRYRGPEGETTAVLAIFEANLGKWLTYSDLAIWRYGDDRTVDTKAVSQSIYRLRQRGYRFVTRDFPWPTVDRKTTRGFLLPAPAESREGVA